MAAEIITKEDLHSFRQELLQEIKELLSDKIPKQKEWLKSPEVRKLLKISPAHFKIFASTEHCVTQD